MYNGSTEVSIIIIITDKLHTAVNNTEEEVREVPDSEVALDQV